MEIFTSDITSLKFLELRPKQAKELLGHLKDLNERGNNSRWNLALPRIIDGYKKAPYEILCLELKTGNEH